MLKLVVVSCLVELMVVSDVLVDAGEVVAWIEVVILVVQMES